MPYLPKSVSQLLEVFRPCFSARTYTTFVALVTGLIAAPARRTVCGMLTAARMAGVWHHGRAHRFFATAQWSLDQVGLTMVGLVVGWLTPAGAPLVVAVDDTLFRRAGRKVHGAFWANDGSRKVAAGQEKLSRGTTFVVAALVVELPFLERPIALPVLYRLWRPGGPTTPTLAQELITLIAGIRPDRRVHVVTDGASLCRTLRHLPSNVTLTGPPPRHAGLYELHPDSAQAQQSRRRGRPRVRAQLVRVIAVREPRTPGFAVVTTDLTSSTAQIIERHAARWAIEIAFHDATHLTGAGEARNRTRRAVERTAPFVILVHTLVVLWYHLAGHSPKVVTEHRRRARWYTTKTHPSYQDMLIKLRRVLIAAHYRADLAGDPTLEQIHAIRLAWADAAA
ncbi:hypothetical protein KALB_4728 [Kutzneria albida DSM 43870]|uniref:Transposase IS701-like DDE domain-containing protein n=1 Tax=Kutzneria albida DSM 43870 TaxID=1449976 RepID=W5WBD5_9PSEU|nr:hypothetical protein KALB_4728 [Kutzneria albida DSM 43870]